MKPKNRFDTIAEENSLQSFLRVMSISSELILDPFLAAISRHVLDGARDNNEVDPNGEYPFRRERDRNLFLILTQSSLIRPSRGTTDVTFCSDPGNAVPFRSPLINVIKDLIRGFQKSSTLYDFHNVTRFASPITVVAKKTVYVAFETVPFAVKGKDGKIIDPRTKRKSRGVCPYYIDRTSVLTIRWPQGIPFLEDIFGNSPYPDDQDVAGTMRWREFKNNPLVKELFQALTLEVQTEDLETHPAINNKFLEPLKFHGNVEPMSSTDGSFDMEMELSNNPLESGNPTLSDISEDQNF